jgi:gamma-glutamyltranspeptidase / glutathione hydrolase
LESPLYDLIGAPLAKLGHEVHPVDGADMGGFQAIMVQRPDLSGPAREQPRVYRGGSDHRKDGAAVGW